MIFSIRQTIRIIGVILFEISNSDSLEAENICRFPDFEKFGFCILALFYRQISVNNLTRIYIISGCLRPQADPGYC